MPGTKKRVALFDEEGQRSDSPSRLRLPLLTARSPFRVLHRELWRRQRANHTGRATTKITSKNGQLRNLINDADAARSQWLTAEEYAFPEHRRLTATRFEMPILCQLNRTTLVAE